MIDKHEANLVHKHIAELKGQLLEKDIEIEHLKQALEEALSRPIIELIKHNDKFLLPETPYKITCGL